jgi:hypothetical protein
MSSDVRREVEALRALGPFPPEDGVEPSLVKKYEDLYKAIRRPVTNSEARILVQLFGPDGFFGLASSMLHLIETAPDWPLEDTLLPSDNEWKIELRNRAKRAGLIG